MPTVDHSNSFSFLLPFFVPDCSVLEAAEAEARSALSPRCAAQLVPADDEPHQKEARW